MSYTYSLTPTNLNKVRILVADTDPATPVFQDEEINTALAQTSSAALLTGASTPGTPVYSVYRAAALLLDALAANKARLAAVVKLLDVDLDAARAARELRATAKQLRDTEDAAGNFAIADMQLIAGATRTSLFGL